MHPFVETISVAGGVAAAFVFSIMALALFFHVLAWMTGKGQRPDSLAIRGILKKETMATVEMEDGKKFERVRFLGYTNAQSIKNALPFELNGLVILDDEPGNRYLVRAKDIRMITILKDDQ